jgi:SpoVK/Ycf46/Vps4 family AAA+-type ATPase
LPTYSTEKKINPGVYDICHDPNVGYYFEQVTVNIEGLIRFPQTNIENVVLEIQKFWERESLFKEYDLPFKRGIMMWGPAGSGKSCIIKLITKDVIARQGIVVRFRNPGLFVTGMRFFREIEPETPVVVLMEDIDSILEQWSESEVLNILDGINDVRKMVFLATTNYPEKLGARIINRPSRFDKRFKIGYPNEESRRIYLEFLFKNKENAEKYDLNKWVKDTNKFSIAHLKELFTAVVILGDEYAASIKTLSTMKEDISSHEDNGKELGFAPYIKNNSKAGY